MGRVKDIVGFALHLAVMVGAVSLVGAALRWRGLLGHDVTWAEWGVDVAVQAGLYWLVWHAFTWPGRARMRRIKDEITQLEMQRLENLAQRGNNVVDLADYEARIARSRELTRRLKAAADVLKDLPEA